MHKIRWISLVLLSVSILRARADNIPLNVTIHWNQPTSVSKLHGSVQLGPESKSAPMHSQLVASLQNLHADFVRYVPWYPVPKLGVAELYAPKDGHTSWNFSLLDSPLEDFLTVTAGHSPIINFSTIPEWMFKTSKPVDPLESTGYPSDYEQGAHLNVSLKQLGDYYGRLVSWYTKGGFKDEYGKWHESDHYFRIPYWEVLNEPDLEHATTPQQYTERYDAIVAAIHRVSPQTKFVGIALGHTLREPKYFLYFLNHQNHRPGIPLDFVSFHFYAFSRPDQGRKEQITTIFDQADQLIDTIRYIGAIRDHFSPDTGMIVDEIGTGTVGWVVPDSSRDYLDFEFQLSTAMYAYLYGQMAGLGVDAANVSGLGVGHPGSMFQDLAMLDPSTGRPNTRYWGLKLLLENVRPGDKLVNTSISQREPWGLPIYAQGFLTPRGQRKVLLVNKHEGSAEITVPGARRGRLEVVDQATGTNPPTSVQLTSDRVDLPGLAEAIVTLP